MVKIGTESCMSDKVAAPAKIAVTRDRRTLKVTGSDGAEHAFTAEMLRVHSPSAEVQGHSAEQKVTVGGKRNVAIADILPVGHYAIRIVFDDGHDTGIFTWSYLAELGRDQDHLWQAYLDELAAKGLSR